MKTEGLIYRYIGQVEEFPEDSKAGDIALKDGKFYTLHEENWEELYLPIQTFDSEVREAVYEAEDSDLKQKLLEIFKKYNSM